MKHSSRLFPALFAIAALAAPFTAAHADTVLGLYASTGQWQSSISGAFESGQSNSDSVDTSSNLDLDKNGNAFISVAVEHPVPVLPNIMLLQSDVELEGDSVLTSSFDFNGATFSANDNVHATIDLSHTDATFYYEVLDNWINLDIGLTARMLDGGARIVRTSDGASEERAAEGTLPLLYLKAEFDLPLSGAYVAVAGNGIGAQGNSITDFSATVGYRSKYRVGMEAGYRRMNITLDDQDDLSTDLTVDGVYAAVTLHI